MFLSDQSLVLYSDIFSMYLGVEPLRRRFIILVYKSIFNIDRRGPRTPLVKDT